MMLGDQNPAGNTPSQRPGTDTTADLQFVPLFQGEARISDHPNEVMTTILGSCIAACMWDPVARVGGMNHFLLPGDSSDRGNNLRYGVNAMELLINGLLKKGADRNRLVVKLFGGAKMFQGGAEIGAKNVSFAKWYMENEGFTVAGGCLGGARGRKIRFWPVSGRVQQCFMTRDIEDIDATRTVAAGELPASKGEIELF